MKIRNKVVLNPLFFILVTIFILSFASQGALACECRVKYDFDLEFALSEAVFSGEVIDTSFEQNEMIAVFRVSKTWKGPKTETLVVRSNMGCAFSFRRGESYLVYAAYDGGLRTSRCSRTVPSAYASDDIKKLSDAGWSPPVKGLRARLSVLPPEKEDNLPTCRVFIEMQNVENVMGSLKVRFDTDRLELRVTDVATGKPLEQFSPPYSGFAPIWDPIPLPYAGSIKFQISYPGMGVKPDARAAIDMGHSNAWVIPTDGSYSLSAKLVIPAEKKDHPIMDWSGILELPGVRIPVCNSALR